jgi:transcription antitermination factor NusG
MLNWYALNSKPHCEQLVHQALSSRGIATFLPLWPSPQNSRRPTRAHPFFPGYLFVHADLEVVGLSALQYLQGVRRLVFFGDQPASIPEAAIRSIERRLAEMQIGAVDAGGRPLSQGDRVVIVGGPFRGYEGIFDRRLSADERVRLLIDFSKKLTPLEIEREFIQKKAVAFTSPHPVRR